MRSRPGTHARGLHAGDRSAANGKSLSASVVLIFKSESEQSRKRVRARACITSEQHRYQHLGHPGHLRHLGHPRSVHVYCWWLERWVRGGESVLYTLAVILLVLWLLGMLSGYAIGAFIHVLLVIAIVLFLVQVISGRRVVP